MSAEELLKSSERSATKNTQYISNVSGRNTKLNTNKKHMSWAATGFVITMLLIAVAIFSSGNIIPAKIQEALVEQTDVQYADMVASKMLVFQQAMQNGEIPSDTINNLKRNNVKVGYIDSNGGFVESDKVSSGVALMLNNKIITADNFIDEVYEDVALYNAINSATYGRAAGYFDEAANKVFEEIGTNRNNYNGEKSIDEVMNILMGNGSDVNVNSVYLEQKQTTNPDTGKTETTYEYVENGSAAKSGKNATDFISMVSEKMTASDSVQSTLNAADSMKVADTIAKEQRSSQYYSAFMENTSMMEAGDGNKSKINDMMNSMFANGESEVVNTKTTEIMKLQGSALDSPSLYSVLSGRSVNMDIVRNYSSDRVLNTVENQLGVSGGANTISGTVSSTTNNTKGAVGRYLDSGGETASKEILEKVEPTINSSLVDNGYDTFVGIDAGEFLVEGAVNVGKKLAKASGGTSGDDAAATQYGRFNNKILAMDAAADRINRSPFDATSKNTFLGAIVYNFAVVSSKYSGIFASINTVSDATRSAVVSLADTSYADGEVGYLSQHGDCETYGTIGAVGSAQCAEIATFDTSTLNDPFHDAGFVEFVEENTTLGSDGIRKINDGSTLAKFINYNNERKTPLGVTDGGILSSLSSDSGSVSFVSDIASMIETFLGANEDDKRIATGEAFVNSSDNPDWGTYKYAQRYVALARATAILKQYSDDDTAYNNIKYFEGEENPVMAYIRHYNNIANK